MIYLDTSSLVKLVVEEAETAALRRFVAQANPKKLVTSARTRAELLRAAQRRAELSVLVAYDARLLGAARGASVPTLTPV